jgi:hypothetical protein
MAYISVSEYAAKYGISERTARNYCAVGKIEGAFLTGRPNIKGYLANTCLTAQGRYKAVMDYFQIKY